MSALQVLKKYEFFIIRNMLVYVDLYCTKRHHSGLRCIKIVGGWGSAPRPRWGSLQRSPDPLAGFRGGEGKEGEGEGRGKVGEERRGEGRGGKGRGQKERPGTTFFTL